TVIEDTPAWRATSIMRIACPPGRTRLSFILAIAPVVSPCSCAWIIASMVTLTRKTLYNNRQPDQRVTLPRVEGGALRLASRGLDDGKRATGVHRCRRDGRSDGGSPAGRRLSADHLRQGRAGYGAAHCARCA